MPRLSSMFVLATLACGAPHQSSRHDGGNGPDGSTDGTSSEPADALVADDMPDALPVIPPEYQCDVTQSGTVNVRTTQPNNTLLVHDVYGTLVARTTSGPNGNVDITVPGCGAVTAIAQNRYHTSTYVRAGDVLWLDVLPGGPPPQSGPGRLYIDTPVPGATAYSVAGPVAAGLVTNTPPTYDLFWTARSLDPQGLTTFVVHPVDSGTGLAAPGTFHVFDNVSLAATIQSPLHLTSWTSQTWTLDLRLAFAQPVHVVGTTARIWHETNMYVGGFGQPTPDGTTHDFSFELPSYGSGISFYTTFHYAPAGNARMQWRVLPLPQAPVVLDLSTGLLPEILAATIAPSTTRPTVSWTLQAGSSASPDLTVLRVRGPIDWRFALPPGMTSYRLPELPPDLALDLSAIQIDLALFDSSVYAGYAAARGHFVDGFINGPTQTMGLVFQSTWLGQVF